MRPRRRQSSKRSLCAKGCSKRPRLARLWNEILQPLHREQLLHEHVAPANRTVSPSGLAVHLWRRYFSSLLGARRHVRRRRHQPAGRCAKGDNSRGLNLACSQTRKPGFTEHSECISGDNGIRSGTSNSWSFAASASRSSPHRLPPGLWRMSGHQRCSMPCAITSLTLAVSPNIGSSASFTRSNRRGTDPCMPGGEGRVASRASPPDQLKRIYRLTRRGSGGSVAPRLCELRRTDALIPQGALVTSYRGRVVVLEVSLSDPVTHQPDHAHGDRDEDCC
ncbi:hypothetical protein ACVWWO_003157 [Bradyrhizobium sp. F1.13.1]